MKFCQLIDKILCLIYTFIEKFKKDIEDLRKIIYAELLLMIFLIYLNLYLQLLEF